MTTNSVVTEALQQTLVNLIDLSLQTKQVHWNIEGEQFRSFHLQLDEITDEIRTNYDDVAERLVTIGAPADGRPATIVQTTDLPPVDGGVLETGKLMQFVEEQLLLVSAKIKERLDAVDAVDHLSNDLLIGVALGLEKQAWMLRSSAK